MGQAGSNLSGRHAAGRADRGGCGMRTIEQEAEDRGIRGGAKGDHVFCSSVNVSISAARRFRMPGSVIR